MRAELLYESAADELKKKLPSLRKIDYSTIDNLMQRISKRYKITGKKLHDLFVSRYGHTPDTWIKKYKEKLGEEGVAEGFGDVVKGIKRKVAGKEDPKDVEHTYGRIARSAIKHKTPDQAEKDIKRWEKVNKVVKKQGVAEAGYPEVDHMPGAIRHDLAKKMRDSSCKRCHGHGTLWKAPDGTILPANNVPGAKRYKCGACDGIGMAKQGVAEGSLEEDKGMTGYNAFKREWRAKHGADAKVPAYDSKEYTSYVYRQNDKKQGVAEGLDEAVGGNYLYHATGADGLKGMLSSGSISKAKGPQKATQAQTEMPTVSVTRDWGYASGAGATQQSFGGLGRDAVIVLDRNAIESNFKTLGTSQSHDIRGLPRVNEPELAGRLKMRAIAMKQPELKGQNKMNFGTAKAGGEFEEAVVVPKGALPLRGTMVGFWVNPKSELMKDPSIMNDPRRLDMVRPNQFTKATQTQGMAEGKQRLDPKCWTGYKKQGTKMKGDTRVNNCVPAESVEEDWNKVNKKDKTSGMSQKAVNAYRRENPGSKLKTAVTTKPSKLKPGSKAAKRRKSFCARMGGNKGPMKKPNGKPTPKALALRRWNCESVEELENLVMIAEQKVAEAKNLKQQAAIAISKKKKGMNEGDVVSMPDRSESDKDFAIYQDGQPVVKFKTRNAAMEFLNMLHEKYPEINYVLKAIPATDLYEGVVVQFPKPSNNQSKKTSMTSLQKKRAMNNRDDDNKVVPIHQKYTTTANSIYDIYETVQSDNIEQIKEFIKWSMITLNMQKPYPKFTLSRDTEQAQKGHRTGMHTGDRIWVYIENRNLVDIFRTIFHELVHHRQDQLGMIKHGDSYPGSPIEALADMMAGKYIKIYGKEHSDIFQ